MDSSTKEKIKNIALSLFAQKGYEGTTMNEIAKGVGIKKASLYAHFKGKEELFFTVYEDLSQEYVNLMNRIIDDSKEMEIEDKLYYIFEQYIIYYIRNPQVQAFWNQIMLFTPTGIYEKFFTHVQNCNIFVQQTMVEIFEAGISQGLIRSDDAKKMTMSFWAIREGLLNGMVIIPEMRKEEYIKAFWRDYLLGIRGRRE
ncbi:transcriptional regulator, TetR family [Desulfofarcimen acetoxidans DSM 771]|uniref:Transcriptional regulator, TetR family n=1 Tax=Desulfofarcimen acetoxidans (strain ATCC 49208 / DSM 771 / KCTC 5769 / VKM B-1644 / 5575) TaxID=485916 RepID=C8W129_DESAS|nr:TetR/AcrR family transcriptional regulator [Desulfofarcimen acetoxidans]ACV63425.1 transcriptional regulator, TetR family [Desulfofarcimen acetoxidans DSM 771]